MFNEVLELFKKPSTTMNQKAEEKNVKKELITLAIIALVMALVTVLTSFISLNKKVKNRYPSLEKYNQNTYYGKLTKEEFNEKKKEYRKDLMEDSKVGEEFFKTGLTVAIAVAVIAGLLYIISRTVKSPKDYISMISITNSAFIIYVLGFLANTIFSYIYAPIGIVALVGASIYAVLSLCNAFRDSLDIENSDKLTIYTTIILTVLIGVLVFIIYNSTIGVLSKITGGFDLLDMF